MDVQVGPDTITAAIIRMKLERKELPAEAAERIWAGYGRGDLCSGCGAPIAENEVEYELAFTNADNGAESVRLHRTCCNIWNIERVALFAMEGASFVRARSYSMRR